VTRFWYTLKNLDSLFFFGQGESNTSMASSSTSYAPPLALLIVCEPSNPSVHETPTNKSKRSYDKFQIFQDF